MNTLYKHRDTWQGSKAQAVFEETILKLRKLGLRNWNARGKRELRRAMRAAYKCRELLNVEELTLLGALLIENKKPGKALEITSQGVEAARINLARSEAQESHEKDGNLITDRMICLAHALILRAMALTEMNPMLARQVAEEARVLLEGAVAIYDWDEIFLQRLQFQLEGVIENISASSRRPQIE